MRNTSSTIMHCKATLAVHVVITSLHPQVYQVLLFITVECLYLGEFNIIIDQMTFNFLYHLPGNIFFC